MSRDWFLPAVVLSFASHAALIWYPWHGDEPPRLHRFRQSVATVSVQRTTVEQAPEAVVEEYKTSPPLADLVRETSIESPVKRLLAEAPLIKPRTELLEPTPTEAPPPEVEPPERAEPPPPDAPPERRPPRKSSAAPPPVEVVIAEQVQEASSANAGEELVQNSLQSNPKPPFPLTHRNQIDEYLELRITVGADGRPQSYTIVDSSGVAEVDRTQAEFIMDNWTWEPARRGGKKIVTSSIIRLNFLKR